MSEYKGVLKGNTLIGHLSVSGEIKVNGEPYKGEYLVTPKVNSQSLDTDFKILLQDVNVAAIPYLEVSNPSGGLTATIGEI